MITINLILLTIFCVIIIDLTDFIDSVKHLIWKFAFKDKPYKDFPFKPFSCSLCSSWWLMLLYLIIIKHLTIPYIVLSLSIAYMTPVIKELLLFIKDFFLKVLDELYMYFKIF